ncbi:hypothetical protein BESB_002500 [Besnoitia besnoiti]|uniref:Transmembrane protein n=1 Tax=Besnoitia besnoiti TaxID=94643 RepID=A0A2A9MJ13_BESBE|nr:hypothetical protein BESB_002500 [Besnoitia besnoiti]PFH37909.1 hypothetical protein BESB_002500 [Besnoitia besnoiti]
MTCNATPHSRLHIFYVLVLIIIAGMYKTSERKPTRFFIQATEANVRSPSLTAVEGESTDTLLHDGIVRDAEGKEDSLLKGSSFDQTERESKADEEATFAFVGRTGEDPAESASEPGDVDPGTGTSENTITANSLSGEEALLGGNSEQTAAEAGAGMHEDFLYASDSIPNADTERVHVGDGFGLGNTEDSTSREGGEELEDNISVGDKVSDDSGDEEAELTGLYLEELSSEDDAGAPDISTFKDEIERGPSPPLGGELGDVDSHTQVEEKGKTGPYRHTSQRNREAGRPLRVSGLDRLRSIFGDPEVSPVKMRDAVLEDSNFASEESIQARGGSRKIEEGEHAGVSDPMAVGKYLDTAKADIGGLGDGYTRHTEERNIKDPDVALLPQDAPGNPDEKEELQATVKSLSVGRDNELDKISRLKAILPAWTANNSLPEGDPGTAACNAGWPSFPDGEYEIVVTTRDTLARLGIAMPVVGGPIYPVFSDSVKVRSAAEDPMQRPEVTKQESLLRDKGISVSVADMSAAVRWEVPEQLIECGRCVAGGVYVSVRVLNSTTDGKEKTLVFSEVEFRSQFPSGRIFSLPASWLVLHGEHSSELIRGAAGLILCVEYGGMPLFVLRRPDRLSQYTAFSEMPFRERVSVLKFRFFRGAKRGESLLEARLAINSQALPVRELVNQEDRTLTFYGIVKGPPRIQSMLVNHALRLSDECVIEREDVKSPVTLDCKGWRKLEKNMRAYEAAKASFLKGNRIRAITFLGLLGLTAASVGLLVAGHRKERGHGILNVHPSDTMHYRTLDALVEFLERRGKIGRRATQWLQTLPRKLIFPGYVVDSLTYIDAMHPGNMRDAYNVARGNTNVVERWLNRGSGREEAAKGVLYKGMGGYGFLASGALSAIIGPVQAAKYIYQRGKKYLKGRATKQQIKSMVDAGGMELEYRISAKTNVVFVVV